MIIKQDKKVGSPSTVGELIGVLMAFDLDTPVQFDDLGLPADVYHIDAEPESGEIHEFTEWIEIRCGE